MQKPAEREKESCLYKFCLNFRLRFNELNNLLIDKQKIEKSVTKYFLMVVNVKTWQAR